MKIEELKKGIVLSIRKNVVITDFDRFKTDDVEMVRLYYSDDFTPNIMRTITVEKFEKDFEFVKGVEDYKKDVRLNELYRKYRKERWDKETQCHAFKTNDHRCTNTRRMYQHYSVDGKEKYCGTHQNWYNNPDRKSIDSCVHTNDEVEYYAQIRARTEVYGKINLSDKLQIVICPVCDMKYAEDADK